MGCKGCLVIGQPRTEECRAKITTRMENDPAHAKRLEDNLTRRTAFATKTGGCCVIRTDATVHVGRHKNLQTPEELRAARLEPMWICDR